MLELLRVTFFSSNFGLVIEISQRVEITRHQDKHRALHVVFRQRCRQDEAVDHFARDDDLSKFKNSAGEARQVRTPTLSGGVFVSMCRTRRVASQCNPTAAHVPVGGEPF